MQVSIAIPFYNAAPYLSQAIVSVINQSYDDWELILIDDGSSDNSLNIALSFERLDNRIRVISDGKNKGLIERLNQSVNIARGVYYARMDADDIMAPNRIELQLKYLKENPRCDVVGSSYFSIDNNNTIKALCNPPFEINWKYPRFLHPSAFAKLEWFKNNPYNKEYERMEDFELWMRTGRNSVIQSIKDPLMFYREFGIPIYSKYLKSQLGLIKLFKNYADYNISKWYAVKMMTFIYSKIVMAWLSKITGNKLDNLLVKFRNNNKIEFDPETAYHLLDMSLRNINPV